MVTVLLFRQIVQMFICIFLGWLLVRLRLMKSEDSRILSLICLYLVYPCIIMNAFQIERTPNLLHGLLLSFSAALGVHLFIFSVERLLRRPLRFSPVESASIIYPNATGFVIPSVTALLGKEWLIFSNCFTLTQLFFLWSYGRMLLSGEKKFSLKKIFWNTNIVSAFVGAILFALKIPIPSLIVNTMDSIGNMVGPLSMLIAGMLIAGMDLKRLLFIPGIWKVVALRMLVIPISAALILKFSGAANLVANGESILLITLLAVSSPTASSVMQIAQVYGENGNYAGAINGITTLSCILTMPLVILLYQL